jgi:hypothetical protein
MFFWCVFLVRFFLVRSAVFGAGCDEYLRTCRRYSDGAGFPLLTSDFQVRGAGLTEPNFYTFPSFTPFSCGAQASRPKLGARSGQGQWDGNASGQPGADPVPTRKVGTGDGMAPKSKSQPLGKPKIGTASFRGFII